mmetsp:Transcript_22412/g.76799  ORF Transcript_22412/g.76799 Transcript_22412/m.76799 type:complete len:249 (+) Transcript_22412:1871-2617(+)
MDLPGVGEGGEEHGICEKRDDVPPVQDVRVVTPALEQRTEQSFQAVGTTHVIEHDRLRAQELVRGPREDLLQEGHELFGQRALACAQGGEQALEQAPDLRVHAHQPPYRFHLGHRRHRAPGHCVCGAAGLHRSEEAGDCPVDVLDGVPGQLLGIQFVVLHAEESRTEARHGPDDREEVQGVRYRLALQLPRLTRRARYRHIGGEAFRVGPGQLRALAVPESPSKKLGQANSLPGPQKALAPALVEMPQ